MHSVLVLAILASCSRSAPRDEPHTAPQPPSPPPQAHAPADAATVAITTIAPPIDAVAAEPEAEVPTEPKALQAWLVAGHYKSWSHESKTHPSEGPHGDAVKTFISPSLAASLARGGDHPRGVAAVKELYTGKKLAHTGWAVSVKVDPNSDDGRNWYWYEVFSTKPGAKPAYAGKGKELCRECHEGGGTDQVLITYPLI